MKMNCYSKIVYGYHGVTGDILMEPEDYDTSPSTVGYNYKLMFSYNFGFSCTRRLSRDVAHLRYEEAELVTFSSFVDPFNPTEDEMLLVKFLTSHYTEIDDVVIALCRELLQYVVEGKQEFEMEELVRQRLKVLEE